jgi:hypothetical protein
MKKIILLLICIIQISSKDLYRPYKSSIEYKKIGDIKLFCKIYNEKWQNRILEIYEIIDKKVNIIEMDDYNDKFYYTEITKGLAIKIYGIFILFPDIDNILRGFSYPEFECILYVLDPENNLIRVEESIFMKKQNHIIYFEFYNEDRLNQKILFIEYF